jgi:VWFA-related protein
MSKRAVISLFVVLSFMPAFGQQPEPAAQRPRRTTPPPPMQEPSPEPDDVVRITTNLVQIDTVVTKDNKPVTDLKAEDFELLEDGKVQSITNFSFVAIPPKPFAAPAAAASSDTNDKGKIPTPPPPVRADEPHRTIALVVDDLGISMESVGSIRKQLRKFVNEEVQANDLIAIVRTGSEVGALQQFTNDKQMLLRAVDAVKWNHCSRAGVWIFGAPGRSNGVGICSDPSRPLHGTVQALRFILQGMRELPGRKSMVIFSENMPVDYYEDYLPTGRNSTSGSRDFRVAQTEAYDLHRLSELAVRSSVVIYGVDTRGLQPLGPYASDTPVVQLRPTGSEPFVQLSNRAHLLTDMRTGQQLLANETGGLLIRNSNNFGLKKIAEEQSGYYLIGYRPTDSTFNRKFHHITVRVKRQGVTARTRSGFFGMTDEEARPLQLTNHDRVNLALMSPFKASDIEVHLTTVFSDMPRVGPVLRSLIYFPGNKIEFLREPDGWATANLNLAAAVFGDNGTVVQHLAQTRELRVRPEQLEVIKRDGLIYQLDVPVAKAGAYQFRVAIRDEGSALVGTARQFVDVPDMKKRPLVLSGITVSGDSNNPTNSQGVHTSVSMSGPAIRRFAGGENLWFGYVIYNAKIDKQVGLPSLTAETKLFRDGALVHQLEPKQVQVAGQSDLERITNGGGIKLGGLPPGEYLLQIQVTEPHGKDKPRVATQWIDFEIVK